MLAQSARKGCVVGEEKSLLREARSEAKEENEASQTVPNGNIVNSALLAEVSLLAIRVTYVLQARMAKETGDSIQTFSLPEVRLGRAS